jgi:hypothetical protein
MTRHRAYTHGHKTQSASQARTADGNSVGLRLGDAVGVSLGSGVGVAEGAGVAGG